MTDNATPDPREERRAAYRAYADAERARHAPKDHDFEPEAPFDEDDVEGHMPYCKKC